jgi:predicted PolB exonuclease-like 3'-5' exonuclease
LVTRWTGKPKGFDGGEVERYFREGKIKEVAQYCESDVVGTYQMWLRYELFCGRLSQNTLDESERNLTGFMSARKLWTPAYS